MNRVILADDAILIRDGLSGLLRQQPIRLPGHRPGSWVPWCHWLSGRGLPRAGVEAS